MSGPILRNFVSKMVVRKSTIKRNIVCSHFRKNLWNQSMETASISYWFVRDVRDLGQLKGSSHFRKNLHTLTLGIRINYNQECRLSNQSESIAVKHIILDCER